MRFSNYIDFANGIVKQAPMDLKNSLPRPWSDDDKLAIFECRVDVWMLGVASAILREIEKSNPPFVWCHAAYGLLTIGFAYFEMIGKTLNPASAIRNTAGIDFNYGFCDVYPAFTPRSGIYRDKLPVPPGSPPGTRELPNPDMQDVIEYRDRVRNGLYHLGYTKTGLWIHNDAGVEQDFEKKIEPDPDNPGLTIEKYRVNPHRLTRTIVDHFPRFVDRVKSTPLKAKFVQFFDHFLSS